MLKFKESLTKALGWIAVVIFAILVITTVWQVFTRLVLNNPSTWSEEFAKVCFVWLSFLGAAFVFGERGHIAVDFMARRFKGGVQKGMALFVQICIFAFAVFAMVWGGIVAAQIAWEQNLTALPLNIGWIYVVIPIAGVAIAIFSVIDAITIAKDEQEAYPEPEDPDEPRGLDEFEEELENVIEDDASLTDDKKVK